MMQPASILRNFSPSATLDFESLPIPVKQHASLCDDAYQRGIEYGTQQAEQVGESNLQAAVAALSAQLNDAQALQQSMIQDFGGALAQIASTLCPALAQKGYAEAIKDMIEANQAMVSSAMTVRVSPDQIETVKQIAGQLNAASLHIESDEALSGLAVELKWVGGGSALNLSDISDQIIALANKFQTTSPSESEEE